MTKTFCDFCEKILIDDYDKVYIGAYGRFMNTTICMICFTDQSNWKRIQKVVLDKDPKILSEKCKFNVPKGGALLPIDKTV